MLQIIILCETQDGRAGIKVFNDSSFHVTYIHDKSINWQQLWYNIIIMHVYTVKHKLSIKLATLECLLIVPACCLLIVPACCLLIVPACCLLIVPACCLLIVPACCLLIVPACDRHLPWASRKRRNVLQIIIYENIYRSHRKHFINSRRTVHVMLPLGHMV